MNMLNTTSIILILASVAIAVLLSLCSAFFRRLRKARPYHGSEGIQMPPISVIVSAFDHPELAVLKLASFLNQEYDGDYEVVLVVDNETIKADSWKYELESLPNLHRLKTTYVPDSSHYVGLQKLAVTLGVKAASFEWIMLTDCHTEPNSRNWLNTMARNCFGKDVVIGYTTVAQEKFSVGKQDSIVSDYRKPFFSKKEKRFDDFQRFERHLWQLYCLRQAENGIPYSAAGGNIMFKKSMFMKGRGYQGNLKYTFGEYEFLVNTYATKENVAVETHPDAWCSRDKFSHHEFVLYHRCFQETRKHLLRKWNHRLLVALDQAVLHLSFPAAFAVMLYSLLHSLWISAAVAPVMLFLGLAVREFLARKSYRRFRIRLTTKLTTHFELYLLWQHVFYKFDYLKADKSEFISHKY